MDSNESIDEMLDKLYDALAEEIYLETGKPKAQTLYEIYKLQYGELDEES